MLTQVKLPQEYNEATLEKLCERIRRRKSQLAESLCILGHHYQADEVIQFADLTGDSLKLSQQAAQQKQAKTIVFCGVHFMAESADILSSPEQVVCLPSFQAGCAMADMAEADTVAGAQEELCAATGAKVIPVTYVNSTAAIKALTAQAGGACCTSSNVRNVFAWALRSEDKGGAGGQKIFAIPDQHLGRNTAVAMGYDLADCAVYDPKLPNGGLSPQQMQRATFLLWKGHCYVHQKFRPEHVHAVRKRHEGIRVIVHPECPYEVVQLADASGSTEQIIRAVAAGRPGSQWAVGTESHLVNRLAKRHPDRFVRVLSDITSICVQMQRIDLPHLAWVLDNLADGNIVNQVSVDAKTAADARVALQRMIDIKAVPEVTTKPAQK